MQKKVTYNGSEYIIEIKKQGFINYICALGFYGNGYFYAALQSNVIPLPLKCTQHDIKPYIAQAIQINIPQKASTCQPVVEWDGEITIL